MSNCPKCGNTDLVLKHTPKDSIVANSSTKAVETEFITSSEYDFYYKLTAKKEHIHCHCRTCQYSWQRNCADATEAKS